MVVTKEYKGTNRERTEQINQFNYLNPESLNSTSKYNTEYGHN